MEKDWIALFIKYTLEYSLWWFGHMCKKSIKAPLGLSWLWES